MMMRRFLILPVVLGLAGCSTLGSSGSPRPIAVAAVPAVPLPEVSAPTTSTGPLPVTGQSSAALDTTSEAEKAAALKPTPSAGEKGLGSAVVALGSPADQGLWVQTNLVTTTQQGRVTAPNGRSLAVELRPTGGAALMSLSAYQALGLNLTELPSLTVYGS